MRAPQHLGKNSLAITALIVVLLGAAPALAASGNISSSAKYAWGSDAGWVNFAPSQAGVTVTDTALTGYAWSANDGWINLSPSQGGVTNDGSGNLGGFAWDESHGWVSFSGVTISSSGKFSGEATGANGFAITFNCSNCDVETTWRPQSASSGLGAISPVFAQLPSATTTPQATATVSATSTLPSPSSVPAATHPRTTVQPAAVATFARGGRAPTEGASQPPSPTGVPTGATTTGSAQAAPRPSTASTTPAHRAGGSPLSIDAIVVGVIAAITVLFMVVRWVL